MSHCRGNLIPQQLNAEAENLPDLMTVLATRHSHKPAFRGLGHNLSFTDLDRLSAAFASYLQHHTNLKKGDRIALQLPNLLQYPVALYGAWRAGLVVVGINPLFTAREVLQQLDDSGAKAIVVYAGMAHKLEPVLPESGLQQVIVTRIGDLHPGLKGTLLSGAVKYLKRMEPDWDLPGAISFRKALQLGEKKAPAAVSLAAEDLAVLQYTGGTTGVPKGAMLTHANLISNMLQCQVHLETADKGWQELVVSPLPLYHIYAFTISLIVMQAGGCSLLIANPRELKGFVSELKRQPFSGFVGLNTLFVALCNQPGFPHLDFSRLKLTISGGMALTHTAARRWQSITGQQINEGYGLTEASPVVALNPPQDVREGQIGTPVMLTEVAVLDPENRPLPPGTAGHLVVRGPQVMCGYWQRDRDTTAAFTKDGFLFTGDIAIQHQDGYLEIVDRLKDVIIVSGFNVYPNEVEQIVCEHPAVTECAVVGETHPLTGQEVRLFAVRDDDNLTADQLKQWCREKLTGYKVPARIEFVEQLPKSNVGKILRRKLRHNTAA